MGILPYGDLASSQNPSRRYFLMASATFARSIPTPPGTFAVQSMEDKDLGIREQVEEVENQVIGTPVQLS